MWILISRFTNQVNQVIPDFIAMFLIWSCIVVEYYFYILLWWIYYYNSLSHYSIFEFRFIDYIKKEYNNYSISQAELRLKFLNEILLL